MMVACAHTDRKKHGRDHYGNQRYRCLLCGKTWIERQPKPLGKMTVAIDDAKMALRLLCEGSSLRSTARITGLQRNTVGKLLLHFGGACERFLDARLRNLKLTHVECDEQHTTVYKKQSRLTVTEKATCYDKGDIYIFTGTDQPTKLLVTFVLGKRTGDSARRFMRDLASRIVFPEANSPDYYRPVIQISTDGFVVYPEAVEHFFGWHARFGTIIKEYRNAKIIYTPSEIVGVKRRAWFNMAGRERSICTSHVERLNGTQRLFLKRLNRLTYCFSKKLRNLECAFAMFATYYNFCWQTRQPGKSGKLRPTAAVMASLTDHNWSFDELFEAVLRPATKP
jgi:transposase-like protein/IS1 family transposase